MVKKPKERALDLGHVLLATNPFIINCITLTALWLEPKDITSIAKALMLSMGFTGEQVTEIWNLSDGCGGPGDHVNH